MACDREVKAVANIQLKMKKAEQCLILLDG